jgi:hypothetical protein
VFRRSTESATLHGLLGKLDATELAESPVFKEFSQEYNELPLVIWFQAPWTFDIRQGYCVAKLLTMVIDLVSTLSHPGGIVLVLGLVSIYDWKYRTQDLIRAANAQGFKHFEAKNFIRECILYGYRHCIWDGTDACHERWLEYHVSHIFIKENERGMRSGGAEEM